MSPSLEKWLALVFDHPTNSQWWMDYEHSARLAIPNKMQLEHVHTLFSDSRRVLQKFSTEQVGQGIWFLLQHCCVEDVMNYPFDCFFDESLDWSSRQSCIAAIPTFFRDYFAGHCSKQYSPTKAEVPQLDTTCYMWWDLMGDDSFTKDHPLKQRVRAACIEAMADTLAIDSRICWWSALHGLGHWGGYAPERADKVIDDFVAAREHVLGAELAQFAAAARAGEIQ